MKGKTFIFLSISRFMLYSATAYAVSNGLGLKRISTSSFTLCGITLPVTRITSPNRSATYEEAVALSLADPNVKQALSCDFGSSGNGRVLIVYLNSGEVYGSVFPE